MYDENKMPLTPDPAAPAPEQEPDEVVSWYVRPDEGQEITDCYVQPGPMPAAAAPKAVRQEKRRSRKGLWTFLVILAVLVGVVLGVAIVSALRGGNTDGYGDDFDDGDHDASSIVDIFQSDVPTIPRADTDPDLRFYCEKAGEEKLTIQQIYQQVNPATVLVLTDLGEKASVGTGVILTADGYIVTNYHVINGASSVKVTLYNGNTYDATVIGGDSDYDVAVLKINAAGLTPVTLGNSADVNVGDSVLAIGNPLGELTFSMSGGYVSSCNRAINVDGTPFNMIQVDCSINPGNSGGPLMNLYGEVVGIVSAKYSTYSSTTVEGLGFAIPIDDVKSIITDIMENGAVTGKAYMAVTVGTMNSQMAAQYSIDIDQGVFVYSVVKGGAGDKAGLRLGDVITKMGDTTLTSRQDLSAALKSYRAGDTATLTVFRDGSYITTDITFDQQPQITGTDTEEDTSSQGGNNGGYSGQIPENWQEFYNYFFGNRG